MEDRYGQTNIGDILGTRKECWGMVPEAVVIPCTVFQRERVQTTCRELLLTVCCLAWPREALFPAGPERGRRATTKTCNRKAGGKPGLAMHGTFGRWESASCGCGIERTDSPRACRVVLRLS